MSRFYSNLKFQFVFLVKDYLAKNLFKSQEFMNLYDYNNNNSNSNSNNNNNNNNNNKKNPLNDNKK
ncbi:hypothetical protein H8356DRAFT_1434871 [Neocallimastix lanati (nom. inval.)]|nr:hypothetical protein H8356DRAFT_1434871 [Neocallimastix sp. JGI-2020a]